MAKTKPKQVREEKEKQPAYTPSFDEPASIVSIDSSEDPGDLAEFTKANSVEEAIGNQSFDN